MTLLSLISEDIHCTRQVHMYSLLADLYTEDIHCTSWILFLYQLLSPCLFSGCGFVISVALTPWFLRQPYKLLSPILRHCHSSHLTISSFLPWWGEKLRREDRRHRHWKNFKGEPNTASSNSTPGGFTRLVRRWTDIRLQRFRVHKAGYFISDL